MKRNKILLFTGLLFFALAAVVYLLGGHPGMFWLLLGVGISMKIGFVGFTLCQPGYRLSPGMYLISTGVGLILLSLLFKSFIPVLWLRTLLFYSAILLKISGVILFFYERRS